MRVFTQKYYIRIKLLKYLSVLFSDRKYLEIVFRMKMGYPLNLDNPQTFSEKLQWLKLNDRHPEYTRLVDKYEVKKYVASVIGEKYVIPTLAVYDRVEDIDYSQLPNQFVLKCTHDSGGIVICKDKDKFDNIAAEKKLRKGLRRNYFLQNREWPYKNVKPRIIAEKYMTDDGEELKDYKIFTFGGEPKIIEIDYNRFKGHLRNLYTTDWQKIDAIIKYPSDEKRVFDKPKVLDELLDLSRKLAFGTPHVRTDFYIVDNQVFFGELTFFHESGMARIEPKEFDKKMGDWICLPTESGGVILNKGNIYIYMRFAKQQHKDLVDYKFFCFKGEPKFCQVIQDRHTKETIDFFDMEWNHQEFVGLNPAAGPAAICPQQPQKYGEMKEIARKLSEGYPFMRIDLYSVNNSVYFGEMTFFPASGLGVFTPDRYNKILGDMIIIQQESCL